MTNTIRSLIALLVMIFSSVASAAVELGKDYTLLDQVQPASSEQIEVLEFFSYDCPNCYRLNQELTRWYSAAAGDVLLIRVPVILNVAMESMARLYYTLQSLGRADGLHGEIYKEVHVRRLGLDNQLSDKPGRLAFIQTLAVDPGNFEAAYSSPDVERSVKDSETIQQRYQIQEIPMLVVDGKYRISGLTADRTVHVLKEVVQMVRDGRRAANFELTAQPNPQPPPRGFVIVDPPRPAGRDVTHCLDLGSYAEIAKCTGEQ